MYFEVLQELMISSVRLYHILCTTICCFLNFSVPVKSLITFHCSLRGSQH